MHNSTPTPQIKQPSTTQNKTKVAILNANYMAKLLERHYPILYRGSNGQVRRVD